MKHWPPPKGKYLKSLFSLALFNKRNADLIHRRARGQFPLCGEKVELDKQTLKDDEVTCPVCRARLREFSK